MVRSAAIPRSHTSYDPRLDSTAAGPRLQEARPTRSRRTGGPTRAGPTARWRALRRRPGVLGVVGVYGMAGVLNRRNRSAASIAPSRGSEPSRRMRRDLLLSEDGSGPGSRFRQLDRPVFQEGPGLQRVSVAPKNLRLAAERRPSGSARRISTRRSDVGRLPGSRWRTARGADSRRASPAADEGDRSVARRADRRSGEPGRPGPSRAARPPSRSGRAPAPADPEIQPPGHRSGIGLGRPRQSEPGWQQRGQIRAFNPTSTPHVGQRRRSCTSTSEVSAGGSAADRVEERPSSRPQNDAILNLYLCSRIAVNILHAACEPFFGNRSILRAGCPSRFEAPGLGFRGPRSARRPRKAATSRDRRGTPDPRNGCNERHLLTMSVRRRDIPASADRGALSFSSGDPRRWSHFPQARRRLADRTHRARDGSAESPTEPTGPERPPRESSRHAPRAVRSFPGLAAPKSGRHAERACYIEEGTAPGFGPGPGGSAGSPTEPTGAGRSPTEPDRAQRLPDRDRQTKPGGPRLPTGRENRHPPRRPEIEAAASARGRAGRSDPSKPKGVPATTEPGRLPREPICGPDRGPGPPITDRGPARRPPPLDPSRPRGGRAFAGPASAVPSHYRPNPARAPRCEPKPRPRVARNRRPNPPRSRPDETKPRLPYASCKESR